MYILSHFIDTASGIRRVENWNRATTFPASKTALAACLVVALCFGRCAAAQWAAFLPLAQLQAAASNAQQMTLAALLVTPLDSKKLKEGEEVDLKTIAAMQLKDGVTVPRGTKVIGHVVQAKARSKGDSESSLAIVFDRVNLPDGQTLAITGTIRAVAPNPNAEAQTGGGVGYGDLTQTFEHPPSPSSTPRGVPLLNQQSKGVLGLKNLQLGADGVLTSDEKSVKLGGGTQIMVQAQVSGG